jgi:acetyl esterase/lipase
MALGYLISVAIPGVPAAAALAPTPRSWLLGQVRWRLTFQLNELPFVAASWVLAATALAVAQGDVVTPTGVAGAAVALLTMIMLAAIVRLELQATATIERGLAKGFGAAWSAELAPEVTVRLEQHRPWVRLLFAPLAVRRRDVVREADLAYGPAGRENLLDLYLPRSGHVTEGCFIYFHGGGYRSGRKNHEARALIYRLASQGWLCASANYRLSGTAAYPAPLIDAKRCIGWMRERTSRDGADASIVVAGSSAGAHLAAMAALTANAAELQPGFEHVDTQVSAAVCLYGFYGSPGWIDHQPGASSAPVECVQQDAPPMLIAHGTHDSFVPIRVARDFVEQFRVRAPTSPVVYLELPGAQHTFDLYYSVRFHAVIDAVDAFTACLAPPTSTHEHERSQHER